MVGALASRRLARRASRRRGHKKCWESCRLGARRPRGNKVRPLAFWKPPPHERQDGVSPLGGCYNRAPSRRTLGEGGVGTGEIFRGAATPLLNASTPYGSAFQS